MDGQTLGGLLREYRLAAGFTQQQLAERAGVSTRSIGYLESGNGHIPRSDTVRLLADALDLSPQEQASFLQAASQLASGASNGTLDRHSTLPFPPTPLVGRTRELEELCALLPTVRLLTLTGPGGVGKTHLALVLSRQVSDAFPAGVTFVDLAPISDAGRVIFALARAIQVREQGSTSLLGQVRQHLQGQHRLIVLDTFEHVLAAAPILAELLATCPMLTLLVTSRAPLHLRGEQSYPLAPLMMPPDAEQTPLEDLAVVPAVALFLTQVKHHRPSFALSATNAASVAAICRRLDGLPLAIELVAPRLAVLSPEAVLERLQEPLDLLAQGARDMPARQRTLRATLAWSYDLLPAAAQALLRRLAIFAGSAGWEAVVQIGAAGQENDTLDLLDLLIAHHLVQPLLPATMEEHVSLLDTVRAFGRERLRACGELADIEQAYADYYLHLAQSALAQSLTAERSAVARRLDYEYANLEATLHWLQGSGDLERALRLAHALAWYWVVRGRFSEGRAWLETLLDQAASSECTCTPLARAWALVSAGRIAYNQSRYPLAESEAQAALDLFVAEGELHGQAEAWNVLGLAAEKQSRFELARERYQACAACSEAVQDPAKYGMALLNLGNIAFLQGKIAEAASCYEAALSQYRKVDCDPSKIARVLGNLATITTVQGDYDRAWDLYQQTMAAMVAIGDVEGIAVTNGNLGSVAIQRGDLEKARELIELALRQQRAIGNQRGVAVALRALGEVHAKSHMLDKALECFRQSLDIHAQIESRQGIALALHEIAGVALETGRPADAIRILAAAQKLAEELTMAWRGEEAEQNARVAQACRELLDDDAYSSAWQEGTAWTLSEAIHHALSLTA